MEVALVFAGLASLIEFGLIIVVTTKVYQANSSDDNLGWLTCAILANVVNAAFIGGMLIYFLIYVYPIVHGR